MEMFDNCFGYIFLIANMMPLDNSIFKTSNSQDENNFISNICISSPGMPSGILHFGMTNEVYHWSVADTLSLFERILSSFDARRARICFEIKEYEIIQIVEYIRIISHDDKQTAWLKRIYKNSYEDWDIEQVIYYPKSIQ